MPELVLEGCRPVPLAHYLKGLGVLRLVAEQKDPGARGYWERERFVLRSALGREELERFFLEEYRPTAIVAPWNGGSGFYPKDNATGLDALAASTSPRFADYRDTIAAAKRVLSELGIENKEGGDTKALLLERCRARFPDNALEWLDAAFVLTAEGPKYPPLLGTGGNDGRLDFTNNFMQRLLWVLDASTGQPSLGAPSLLRGALFAEATSELVRSAPIGQFLPSDAGGANASTGFGAESLINPWDFILMLEGACVFATATARRTETELGGGLSYPFTVRTVGVGYASAAQAEESSARAEMWLPLWGRPASAPEILRLLSEGRVRVGRRTAHNGVDFARAVAALGVDRGIDAFERYGFHVRNGLAYFAVPLGRFSVRGEPRAALLQELDGWLEGFRRRASGDQAPASAVRALRNLEASILQLCAHGDNLRLQQVLVALGSCERALAGSTQWTQESFLQPIPALCPEWLQQADDGSVVFRLAASLASVFGRYGSAGKLVPLRRQLEPVSTWKGELGMRVRWDLEAGRDVVASSGDPIDVLNAVLARRLLLAVQAGEGSYPDTGRYRASLGDIADFVEGRVDDRALLDLLWGCLLIDWTRFDARTGRVGRPRPRSPLPGGLYSLLKLCFPGAARSPLARGDAIPIVPRIHRLAMAGHGSEASREAVRRLRGSAVVPAVAAFQVGAEVARRSAAALLLPISEEDRALLAQLIARPSTVDAAIDSATSTVSGANS